MAIDGELTPGELSRRVQELLLQFEALLRKIEDRYVQKEMLELIRSTLEQAIQGVAQSATALDQNKVSNNEMLSVRSAIDSKADKGDLVALKATVDGKADASTLAAIKDDVDELKDHNKWLFRVIGAFIILGILGAVFVAGGGVGK